MTTTSATTTGAPLFPTEPATELSARRTGMSFQRTRLSADRTLMSVLRTSLSLISFGFTIFQFLGKLKQAGQLAGDGTGVREFGLTLVVLGVLMLIVGIFYHLLFMRGLRDLRTSMMSEGLIHGQSGFPPSLTLMTAVLLLAFGLVAIAGMAFGIGPFG